MNQLIVRLQEVTNNSSSKHQATINILKQIPTLNYQIANEIAFNAREYCIGNLNAVRFNDYLISKGL